MKQSTLYGAITLVTILVLSGLYFVFDFQAKQQAKSFVESWAATEDLAVQEGNIVGAFSRQQRVLLGSKFIRAFTTVDKDSVGNQYSDPLISFGENIEMKPEYIPESVAKVQIARLSSFEYFATYRFEHRPSIVVGFWISPQFVQSAFVVSALGFVTILLIVVVLVRLYSRMESERRFELVNSSLLLLAKGDRPSEKILSECPQLSEAWQPLNTELKRLRDAENENLVDKAVATSMRMIAHDVRQPITLAKAALENVSAAKNMNEISEGLRDATDQVERSFSSVNTLLRNIMDVGSDFALGAEPIRIERLIASTIADLSVSFPRANPNFTYEFNHKNTAMGDEFQLGRVIANILTNAIEATSTDGRDLRIGITTRSVQVSGKPFLEISISNNGPAIPAEILSQIFRPYVTKGKRHGTGLGLVIAKRIAEAHGGTIRCEHDDKGNVAFAFTVPLGGVEYALDVSFLPKTLHEARKSMQSSSEAQSQNSLAAIEALEESITKEWAREKAPLHVLIVDDEPLYRHSIASAFTENRRISQRLVISFASNATEAERVLQRSNIELVVLDLDLGANSASGFDVLADMRKNNHQALVCIHTNRSLSVEDVRNIEQGGDIYLPKPMGREQSLRLIQRTFRKVSAFPVTDVGQLTSIDNDFVFVFVDDSGIIRRSWTKKWPIGRLETFENPAHFWERVASDPGFVLSVRAFFVDYNFGNDAIKGSELARELRLRTAAPVFLATNESFEDSEIDEVAHAIHDKSCPTREQLFELLAAADALIQAKSQGAGS